MRTSRSNFPNRHLAIGAIFFCFEVVLVGGYYSTFAAAERNETLAQNNSVSSPEQPVTDLFGDRLPSGGITRIGTVRNAGDLPNGYTPPNSLRGLVFSGDGSWLATYGEPADPKQPRRIRIWDARTGKPLKSLPGHDGPIKRIALSPDGKVLASTSFDISTQMGITRIWNIADAKSIGVIPEGGAAIRFSPDGKSFTVIVRDQVRVYRVSNGQEVQRFLGPNLGLSFSPNRQKLLAVSHTRDNVLRVYDVPTGKELLKLEGCKTRPPVAVFSPDGRTIAAADGKNDIVVWELATGSEVYRLKGHSRKVFAIAFSPDGRFLASGGADRSVRLWEIASGKEAHAFSGHAGVVTTLAFSSDGQRLASGSTDRTALVWRLDGMLRSFLPTKTLDEPAMDRLWDDLASGKTSSAYQAIGLIIFDDEQSLPYLETRLTEIFNPAQNARIQDLIRQLDADDSVERQRATQELKKLLNIAKPVLLKALKETDSAEVGYRIRRILRGSEDTPRFSRADMRRMLRIIHAMGRIESDRAREILGMIIEDFPSEPIVKEAREALEQIRSR